LGPLSLDPPDPPSLEPSLEPLCVAVGLGDGVGESCDPSSEADESPLVADPSCVPSVVVVDPP
jgi:hypothetical protein